MTKYVKIEFDNEEQYESLKETKDHYGFTWKGMLLKAQRTLESQPSDEE
ncbi:hypothetical protein [Haloprofundus marisrubri]|nr:hypothetical protein [Haloprofundus marisrubri]